MFSPEVSRQYAIAFQFEPFTSMSFEERFRVVECLEKAASMADVPMDIKAMYKIAMGKPKRSGRRKNAFCIDAELHNADWTKQTWDLDIHTAEELDAYLKNSGQTPKQFMKLPVFEAGARSLDWLAEWGNKQNKRTLHNR